MQKQNSLFPVLRYTCLVASAVPGCPQADIFCYWMGGTTINLLAPFLWFRERMLSMCWGWGGERGRADLGWWLTLLGRHGLLGLRGDPRACRAGRPLTVHEPCVSFREEAIQGHRPPVQMEVPHPREGHSACEGHIHWEQTHRQGPHCACTVSSQNLRDGFMPRGCSDI